MSEDKLRTEQVTAEEATRLLSTEKSSVKW